MIVEGRKKRGGGGGVGGGRKEIRRPKCPSELRSTLEMHHKTAPFVAWQLKSIITVVVAAVVVASPFPCSVPEASRESEPVEEKRRSVLDRRFSTSKKS